MADDFIDQWDINGSLYDIHDKGRGQPNGVAQLDGSGRVPFSQLPESSVEYKGGWDASTNTPTLAAGVGTNGDMYVCTVAGQRDLGEGTKYFFPNDRVIYSGTLQVWQKFSAGDVKSVGGVAPTPSTGNVPVEGAISNIFSSNFTTKNRVLVSDANGKVAESSITAAELGTLSGITGNIQDQIDGKEDKVTGAATTVLSLDLAVNRVLVSDANGKIAVSSVSATGISTVPTNHASSADTYGPSSESDYGHCKARLHTFYAGDIIADLLDVYTLDGSEHNAPVNILDASWPDTQGTFPLTKTFNIHISDNLGDRRRLTPVYLNISYDGISWVKIPATQLMTSEEYLKITTWQWENDWTITLNLASVQVQPYIRFMKLRCIIESPSALPLIGYVNS